MLRTCDAAGYATRAAGALHIALLAALARPALHRYRWCSWWQRRLLAGRVPPLPGPHLVREGGEGALAQVELLHQGGEGG